MKDTGKRPLKIRALNAICVCVLLSSLLYILFSGAEAVALGAIALSLAGVATPVVLGGEGVLEIVVGITT